MGFIHNSGHTHDAFVLLLCPLEIDNGRDIEALYMHT
jgi:hypothetical protein